MLFLRRMYIWYYYCYFNYCYLTDYVILPYYFILLTSATMLWFLFIGNWKSLHVWHDPRSCIVTSYNENMTYYLIFLSAVLYQSLSRRLEKRQLHALKSLQLMTEAICNSWYWIVHKRRLFNLCANATTWLTRRQKLSFRTIRRASSAKH